MIQFNSFILRITLVFILFCGINEGFHAQVKPNTLEKDYQKEKNITKRFWKLYKLALYYQTFDYHKADSIKESLLILSYSANDSAKYVAQIYDAEVDLLKGDKSSYFNKILGMQSFIARLPNKSIKLDLYQRLGEYHIYHRELDQAIIYLDEALKISKKLRKNNLISKSYRLISQNYMLMNRRDTCYYFVDLALQFSRRSGDELIKSDALFNQAQTYAYFGQIDLSVSKNQLALDNANQVSNYARIAKISINIGEAQLQVSNFKEAEFYFNNALQNSYNIRDYRTVAICQIYLGVVQLGKKNYEKATDYVRKALKLLQNYNDNDALGFAHNTYGDIYREQKDFAMALRYYNKALVYFESSGNREQSAVVYHNVGYVFEKQGKYDNALNYLDRSVNIRSQFGYKGTIYATYQTISDVYFKTGNLPLAYKYLKLYTVYSDSAKILETNTKIVELSELYRSEERQKLISIQADSLERQNQEKALTSAQLENIQLKTNLQTYIIIGFVLFMILAGIIGFYRWNQTKIKQQQQQAEMNQTLLRAQMNPHFVFNAMSVIQSYIYDNDTKNSAKFLVNFQN
jgi:tetratricopeptide (TPR) repeat protein